MPIITYLSNLYESQGIEEPADRQTKFINIFIIECAKNSTKFNTNVLKICCYN